MTKDFIKWRRPDDLMERTPDTNRRSDFYPVYLQEKYKPKLNEDFRITTGLERNDRWLKYAMGDFELTPTPTAL